MHLLMEGAMFNVWSSYGLQMTMAVLECWYDFGVDGQGEISLESVCSACYTNSFYIDWQMLFIICHNDYFEPSLHLMMESVQI